MLVRPSGGFPYRKPNTASFLFLLLRNSERFVCIAMLRSLSLSVRRCFLDLRCAGLLVKTLASSSSLTVARHPKICVQKLSPAFTRYALGRLKLALCVSDMLWRQVKFLIVRKWRLSLISAVCFKLACFLRCLRLRSCLLFGSSCGNTIIYWFFCGGG